MQAIQRVKTVEEREGKDGGEKAQEGAAEGVKEEGEGEEGEQKGVGERGESGGQ